VLWAWERPEDLRFAVPDITIAILAGTVRLTGDGVVARPRLQPALVPMANPIAGVAHLEIDRARPLVWTADQRIRTAAAVLALLGNPRFHEVQIDFEVRASERRVLLDVLTDLRAALPVGRHLSMTALASWCETETWIDRAPVDEIVPMLFRMGPDGQPIRQRLANGGDFARAACRTSIGIAADGLPDGLPAGRRLWLFSPLPWTAGDLTTVRDRLHA
jgi:hypothetical protein